MAEEPLGRAAASTGVERAGWRLLYDSLAAAVPVRNLQEAARVAAAAVDACAADADAHLKVDLRADHAAFVLKSGNGVTARDVELAGGITAAVQGLGFEIGPVAGAAGANPVQLVSFMIDALDIAAVRPFWKAVLAYADGPDEDALVDPAGRAPMLLFQQMDEPRPQRNRIHIDVDVAHDEAERRIEAALDAGGVLVTDRFASAWWVLADVEGNEACICTWQDRD